MLSLEQLQALQIKAIQHGAQVHYHTDRYGKPSTVEWDISGRCERPAVVELIARQSVRVYAVTTRKLTRFRSCASGFARLILHTVCRKCSACRRKRQRMWYNRAKSEFEAGSRNWFGTLTLSPEEHFMCETRIRAYLGKQGVDFESLPASEQFQLRVSEAGKHVTLWLKRVRKNSGARIRYLMVCEAHKSGLPHFHVLIHEQGIDAPVRWQVLSDAWGVGFSQFKLAKEPRAALYLTKYLTKRMDVRIRASARYGNNHRLDDSLAGGLKREIHRPTPDYRQSGVAGGVYGAGSVTTGPSPALVKVCEASRNEDKNGQSLSVNVGTAGLSGCAETVDAKSTPSCGSSSTTASAGYAPKGPSGSSAEACPCETTASKPDVAGSGSRGIQSSAVSPGTSPPANP